MVRVRQTRGKPTNVGKPKLLESEKTQKKAYKEETLNPVLMESENSDLKESSKPNINALGTLDAGVQDVQYQQEQASDESTSNIDYCKTFLQSIDWNRPIKRTTDMSPWIEKEEWKYSLAEKYMNYEMEPNYIDLDNPIYDGPLIEDLRKKESRRKHKKKDVSSAEFSVIKEGVVEVDQPKLSDTSDSEDNFVDEFGNLKEDISESSDEESILDPTEGTGENVDKGGKKKRNKNKKKRKGKGKSSGNYIKPVGNSGDIIQDEVLKQSDKYFIDYDKVPGEKLKTGQNSQSKTISSNEEVKKANQNENIHPESHLTMKFHFEEPEHSILNKKEQETYLKLMLKFRLQPQSSINLLQSDEKNEYDILLAFREAVQEEQEKYQNWCKEAFIQNGDSDVNYMPTDVRRYINEYYEERLARVVKQIPRLYRSTSHIDSKRCAATNELLRLVPMIKEQTISKPRFEMRIEKTICKLGCIPKIIIPNEKTVTQNKSKMVLPRDYQKLCEKYPPSDAIPDALKAKDSQHPQLYKTTVSSDPNADKLARIYKPDIVISTSAIKTIFNNFGPNYEREWEVPVTLWLIEEGRCIIFVDKPLPRKNMNIIDKKKWYAKIAVKSFLLHPQGKSKFVKNGADSHSSQTRHERNFKSYDDLTLFQLDGMFDGNSSSEENMVIDEGSQNEIESVTSRNTLERPIKSSMQNNIPLDEDSQSENFMTVGYCKNINVPDNLKKSLGIDNDFRILSNTSEETQMVIGEGPQNESESVTYPNNFEKPQSSSSQNDIPLKDFQSKNLTVNKSTNSCEEEGSGNSKGKTNKLDEILHRLKMNEKSNARGRRGARGRGRGKRGNISRESIETGNVLSDIMAAQEKTSQIVRNEALCRNPISIRNQIHEFTGLNNAYAETGDVQKDYKHPVEDTNVNYSLWKLERKSEPDLIHKVEKPLPDNSLQILVRSGIHGARLEHNLNSPSETDIQYYTIDCKVENQVEFGGEIVSKAELAKQWIATLLRPNSRLARLRVNVANQEVLMAENKSLKDLTKDGSKIGFKPEETLGNLFTLFSELKKLPIPTEKEGVARYLLRHDSKTGAFVKIMKSVEPTETSVLPNSGTVDVHLPYSTCSNEEAPLPPVSTRWLPIDADLITPYHEANKKVPCLFSPKPFNKNNSPRGRGRGRGRNFKKLN